jgi:6,7-dimethyl-8-ribityllumazine synthase
MSSEHVTRTATAQTARTGVTVVAPRAQEAPPRVAVIASQFNGAVVDRLVDGAISALAARGLRDAQVALIRVPGAWELPLAARAVAEAEGADAIIALGCVIRGETSHYDVIVNESARGLAEVALQYGLPVANGVLACDSAEQALARAGGDSGNKGDEAAQAALDMLAVLDGIGAWAGRA